jgi:hypothetical protein
VDAAEFREDLIFVLAGGAILVLVVFFVFFSTTGAG